MAEPVVTDASRVTSIVLRDDGRYVVGPGTFRVGPWLWRLPDGEEVPAELLAFEFIGSNGGIIHGQLRDLISVDLEPPA